MTKKQIDYKKQLELLRDIMGNFFIDKTMSNAFTDFEKGHQKATKELSKDIIKVIDMALKGELKDDEE